MERTYLLLTLLVYKVAFTIAIDFVPSHYIEIQEPLGFIKYQGIFVILGIFIISAIDYLILIIFMKVKKISHLVSINILIIISIQSYSFITSQAPLSAITPNTLFTVMVYICMIAIVIIGSILGRKILNIVNSRTTKFKELVSK